jgi:uncharacterized protein (DUF1330 family)
MSAFVISDVSVNNAEAIEAYRSRAAASVARWRALSGPGGAVERMEGGWAPNLIVVVESPDMEQARAWYHSPEYASALEVRDAALSRNLILVDGVTA